MIKSVIFDFDGTLADSGFAVDRLMDYFIRKYRINNIGNRNFRNINTLPLRQRFKELGIPLYKLPLISLEAIRVYSRFVAEIKLIEGIEKLLCKLSEHSIELNILSSNSVRNIKRVLQKNKIDFFSGVYSTSNIIKKDRALLKLIKKRKLSRDNIIYVGDQLNDVISCKRIQVKVAAVCWGSDSEDLLMQGKPDYLCRKPSDLYNFLISGSTD